MKKTNKIFGVLWVIISICHSMSKGTEISFSVGYVFGILLLPYLIVWMYIKFFKKTTPQQPVVKEVEHHEFREKTKLKENEIVEPTLKEKKVVEPALKENEIVESTLIEEVVSSDLLRIMTKAFAAKFVCFEFKKDSIKSYKLEEDRWDYKYKKEGKQQYFYKNVNNPLYKVDEKIMQIKSGTIFQSDSDVKFDDAEIMDFRMETVEHNSSRDNTFRTWLKICEFKKYTDGSSGWGVGEWSFDISELKKVEKILYLLKNVSSFNDMKLLDKSYVKYSNDLLGNKKN